MKEEITEFGKLYGYVYSNCSVLIWSDVETKSQTLHAYADIGLGTLFKTKENELYIKMYDTGMVIKINAKSFVKYITCKQAGDFIYLKA